MWRKSFEGRFGFFDYKFRVFVIRVGFFEGLWIVGIKNFRCLLKMYIFRYVLGGLEFWGRSLGRKFFIRFIVVFRFIKVEIWVGLVVGERIEVGV